MNEDETIMHMIVQVLGADGITVTMELGQLIGLQRLLACRARAIDGPAWLHSHRRGGRGWDQPGRRVVLGW